MSEQERKNWVAHMGLENLTQDQVNDLTLKIVEWVESYGGYIGGGFSEDHEVDDAEESATV